MPSTEVMHEWKAGRLHSGAKKGPIVKSKKQALAIMFSEKDKEKKGKSKKKSRKDQYDALKGGK